MLRRHGRDLIGLCPFDDDREPAAHGATLAELMRRLGHRSPAIALRYQRASDDRDAALAELLGRTLGEARAPVVDLGRARQGPKDPYETPSEQKNRRSQA